MRLPPRRALKTDANQSEIVQALRKAGADVWIIGSPADALCGFSGRFTTIEIKDGRKSPSRQALTADEQAFLKRCRQAGYPHYVVRTPEEALHAIGAIR
jgi:hypothetical protein